MFKLMPKIAALAATSLLTANMAYAASVKTPKAVVEVFTSQGCHSCPPADKIVQKFSMDGDILAISVHVDYWDYLGWKDIFASKDNTSRQYGYAKSMGESQVYTPQAVINGRDHVVGSRESAIHQVIDKHDALSTGLSVPINANVDNNSIEISIDANSKIGEATLFVVSMKKSESVKIKRGENTGKTIEYHNILSAMQPIGMLKPSGLKIDYPIADQKAKGHDRYAFILQSTDRRGNPGAIIGAVYIEDL